ncbi:MAG: response regulator [Candidatus Nitrosotenuis sp.]|nr:MAG: response regulator [Candidatus Nitrosotenuis sp.]
MVRILLVDDERDILSSIKKGLTANGFEVDTYDSPQQALEEFKPHRYDLAILDFKMPSMTGFELYRELKKRQPDIRVNFLTAFDMDFDAIESVLLDLDVKCFIQKPTTIAKLVEQIRRETAG